MLREAFDHLTEAALRIASLIQQNVNHKQIIDLVVEVVQLERQRIDRQGPPAGGQVLRTLGNLAQASGVPYETLQGYYSLKNLPAEILSLLDTEGPQRLSLEQVLGSQRLPAKLRSQTPVEAFGTRSSKVARTVQDDIEEIRIAVDFTELEALRIPDGRAIEQYRDLLSMAFSLVETKDLETMVLQCDSIFAKIKAVQQALDPLHEVLKKKLAARSRIIPRV